MANLSDAAASLREAGLRLGSLLSGAKLVDHPSRGRATELLADISTMAGIVEDAWEEASLRWEDEGRSALTLNPHVEALRRLPIAKMMIGGGPSTKPDSRLATSLKALFMFVRAYQDAAYALLFQLTTGKAVGNSRMQNAVERPENPVGRVLRERLPEYVRWFPQWRERRNRVKDGVNFGLVVVGPGPEIAITFNTYGERGELIMDFGQVIRREAVAQALAMTQSLVELAEQVALETLERERSNWP